MSIKFDYSYGLVVFCGDHVLMVQNKEKMFGFPKGHAENNETPVQAAIREVFEETGIRVSTSEIKGDVDINFECSIFKNDDLFNQYIYKMKEMGKIPVWNRYDIKKTVFKVAHIENMIVPRMQNEGIADGLIDVKWVHINDAPSFIIKSGSNQLPIFQRAIELLNI